MSPTDPSSPASSNRHRPERCPPISRPAEADGGWRKRTTTTQIRELGLEAAKLNDLGHYLMSQPYENYQTGVSGYKPSNKAAIVVKERLDRRRVLQPVGRGQGTLLRGVER